VNAANALFDIYVPFRREKNIKTLGYTPPFTAPKDAKPALAHDRNGLNGNGNGPFSALNHFTYSDLAAAFVRSDGSGPNGNRGR
jgi:hypothetical protein